ncbi:MAG TPA: DUF4870 domain-containing protein [Myxococcota bacterium]
MTTSYELDQELNDMADAELRRERAQNASSARSFSSSVPTVVHARDEKNLAMLTHLATGAAAIFSGGLLHIAVPAIAYAAFHERGSLIREHAKAQLNFQLTLLAVIVAAVVISVVTLGVGLVVAIPAVLAFFVMDIFCTIRAAMAASRGEDYAFPLSLQLVR